MRWECVVDRKHQIGEMCVIMGTFVAVRKCVIMRECVVMGRKVVLIMGRVVMARKVVLVVGWWFELRQEQTRIRRSSLVLLLSPPLGSPVLKPHLPCRLEGIINRLLKDYKIEYKIVTFDMALIRVNC